MHEDHGCTLVAINEAVIEGNRFQERSGLASN
jgi:hypothetical protein